MSTTQPIRSKKELHDFKGFYAFHTKDKPNALRNQTLIILGLNTALRISDILKITWDDVFDGKKVRKHIVIREQKTGKENRILINTEAKEILLKYYRSQLKRLKSAGEPGSSYLFPSPKKKGNHLSRYQAHRIISHAAEELHMEHVSCHSLRKTFGYHAWKQGVQPALLMSIFNHSSWQVTMRYLGITQDEKDKVFGQIAF